jgi:hypothetical protein
VQLPTSIFFSLRSIEHETTDTGKKGQTDRQDDNVLLSQQPGNGDDDNNPSPYDILVL